MLLCLYCNKEVKNENSKKQHEIRCKINPNSIKVKPSYGMTGKSGSNQYIKGTAKPLTVETRLKLGMSGKNRIWTEEMRKKHSESMKKAVEENPESYTSSNRGRTKQIIYNDIKFQGSWELEFYKYCEKNDIKVERVNEWFEYEWNGIRKYFPDFYLPDYDLYIEIKGYETDKDHAKWTQFPKKLKVIKKKEIFAIKKGCFGGL